MARDFPPLHPGEVLQEEFLEPLGISQNRLSRSMRVPPGRINEIINGTRGITADTTIRLGCALTTGPEFWMNLQMMYDLETAREKAAADVCSEVIPLVASAD